MPDASQRALHLCFLIMAGSAVVGAESSLAFPFPFGFFKRVAPPCAGAFVGGYCWYLAGENVNCSTACASHGGTTNGTIDYVGTGASGSMAAQCQAVMAALTGASVPFSSIALASGFGCWQAISPTYYYATTSPATDLTSSLFNGRRACSCVR